MKLLIATTFVPFVRGGAEIHAESLQRELRRAGHEAEIVAMPFKWYPPERVLDHMLACRLMDLTESSGNAVDRVIGLKFPAYLIPHPNKVLWILHQHRSAYDLWNRPMGDIHEYANGTAVRDAIRAADIALIPEARHVYANSGNVANRLRHYCGLDAEPLYHPPAHAERFHCAEPEHFIFYPSRLCPMKRQKLVIEALAHTRQPVTVKFAGLPDSPSFLDEIEGLAVSLGVDNRIEWLGGVSEEQKIDLYARCLGVVYPPVDEDYGYITLEAMLSSKPVVTCSDSGGPLEFVIDGLNGLVSEPTPQALGQALDELWSDISRARRFGAVARESYELMGISWKNVIEALLRN